MDHKLTRTGCKRDRAIPPLLGLHGRYCLSPGVLTKEWIYWEVNGEVWGRYREWEGLCSELWLSSCIERRNMLEAFGLLPPGLFPFPLKRPEIGPVLADCKLHAGPGAVTSACHA